MDISLIWGGDMALASNGDLSLSDGSQRNQERILRRLMTNPQVLNGDGTITPGDYAQHPDYGAGLPRWVGALVDIPKITAQIRGQMLAEDCVKRLPEPQIEVHAIPEGVSCYIQYVDATTNTSQTLSFNVTK